METDDASGYRACLRCGQIMPAAALYCHSCGADLSAEPAPGLRGAATLEGFGESLRSSQVPETGTSPAARPPSTTDGSSTETAAGSYYRAAPPSCPAYAYSPLAYAQRRTDNLAIASLACALASYALVPILAAVAGTAAIALKDTDARASAAAHVAMMDELNKGIQTYRVLQRNVLPDRFDSLMVSATPDMAGATAAEPLSILGFEVGVDGAVVEDAVLTGAGVVECEDHRGLAGRDLHGPLDHLLDSRRVEAVRSQEGDVETELVGGKMALPGADQMIHQHRDIGRSGRRRNFAQIARCHPPGFRADGYFQKSIRLISSQCQL